MGKYSSCHLKLCEDFLDVSEASLGNVKVLLERPTLEHWLGSVLKEPRERKQLLYFLHSGALQSTHF